MNGGRTMTQDDNSFKVTDVEDNIKKELAQRRICLSKRIYNNDSAQYC